MEMLVIAVVAIIAFAAVLVPLFRRSNTGATREFDNLSRPKVPRQSEPPAVASQPTDQPAPPASQTAPPPADTTRPVAADDLEREVERYREAVRAETVCRKCGQANPADSTYCYECGNALPRAEAREFE